MKYRVEATLSRTRTGTVEVEAGNPAEAAEAAWREMSGRFGSGWDAADFDVSDAATGEVLGRTVFSPHRGGEAGEGPEGGCDGR